jgi:hypothetical protein
MLDNYFPSPELGKPPVLPCAQPLWSRLPAQEGYSTTTCLAALSMVSPLVGPLVLPHGPQYWAPAAAR